LVATADIPSSPILFTLMIEAILSSETLVLTNAAWLHFNEDGIIQVSQLFGMVLVDK
jgi:hypothetical protein